MRTDIVTLASGCEQRNSRWSSSRRRYDAGLGVRTVDALHAVIAFFEERRGRLYGFRFRDRTDWHSGPPSKLIGSKAATIPAGLGRRSAAVTLDASETGHVMVRLQPTNACSFKSVKLEVGAYATPWAATPIEVEELRCRRYYQRLPTAADTPALLGVPGHRVANAIDFAFALPVSMRADPIILSSNSSGRACLPSATRLASTPMLARPGPPYRAR